MTKEEFANELDGGEYPFELTNDQEARAKAADLLVIYGASDDLMEFEGAWSDEVGVYNGGSASITRTGVAKPWEQIDNEDIDECRAYFQAEGQGRKVEAVWGEGVSWQYRTEVPHATFKIMEDGEVYCIGIVINIEDLAN